MGDGVEHFGLALGAVVGGKVDGVLEIYFVVDNQTDVDDHCEQNK